MDTERRRFLQMLGAGAAAAALPLSIRKALAVPAHHRTGTLEDVEHIVFLMKENRSFDHYFGSLRGVRGFGDPHPARMPNGDAVWSQPGPDGPVLPYRPDVPDLGMRFLWGPRHDWNSTHAAWREGWYDSWVWYKNALTMAHLAREDVPFHFALADAFTVCDAYHCSLLGPTQPNRMHMWTGWVGNDGKGGGPAVDNLDPAVPLDWTTYPERLTQAGVSWRIYQDVGRGMSAGNYWGLGRNPYMGNYGCNTLLFFKAYQQAKAHSALYRNARTGTRVMDGGSLFQELRSDVRNDRLPKISWIIAPGAYSEHPYWPANWGAWYTAQILDALTSNPEVWSKTVLFLTYDENDGFFDHVVPATPPMGPAMGQSTVSTENEIYPGAREVPGGPYGLGLRVPMIVISPWSKGGWVNSQVFDHTSMLRFAEERFGVRAENITPWRRAVCGDLTSTLDFAHPSEYEPDLPRTAAYAPPQRRDWDVLYRTYLSQKYTPEPPAEPRMPTQEPGQRPARPVPYELHVEPRVTAAGIDLGLRNRGSATASFQVRSGNLVPRSYTVGAGASLHGSWKSPGRYALEVHGPNGFYRVLEGLPDQHPGELALRYDKAGGAVELQMTPTQRVQLTIRDAHTRRVRVFDLPAGRPWRHAWPLASSQGWYDLDVRRSDQPGFRRHFAGHLETGRNSHSDPLFGTADRFS